MPLLTPDTKSPVTQLLEASKSAEVITGADDIERALADGRLKSKGIVSLQDHGHCVRKRLDGGMVAATAVTDLAAVQAAAAERGIEWQPGMEGRIRSFRASDERVDRHGEIVLQSWELGEYKTNPLVLYGHSWGTPPIGNSLGEDLVSVKDADYEGPAMRMRLLFSDDWGLAQSTWRLVKAGFLKTGSVSFFPGEVVRIQDPEERLKFGKRFNGTLYRSNSLVEFTIASVPANTGARINLWLDAAGKKAVLPEDIATIRELVRRDFAQNPGPGDSRAYREADMELVALASRVFPDLRLRVNAGLDVPVLYCDGAPGDQADELAAQRHADLTGKLESLCSCVADLRSAIEAQASARSIEPLHDDVTNSQLQSLLATTKKTADSLARSK